MTEAETSFAVIYVITKAGTVTSSIYLGVRFGTVAPGVLGRDITLAVFIWIIGPWFLVAVAWSHSVWVVVIDVGMLGLIYCGAKYLLGRIDL